MSPAAAPRASHGEVQPCKDSPTGVERRENRTGPVEDRASNIMWGLKSDLFKVMDRSKRQRIRRDKGEDRFGDFTPRVQFRGMSDGPQSEEEDEAQADTPFDIRNLVLNASDAEVKKAVGDHEGSDYLQAQELVRKRNEHGKTLAGLGEVLFEYGFEPIRAEDVRGSFFQGNLYSLPASIGHWGRQRDIRLYAFCGGFTESGESFFEFDPELLGIRNNIALGCDIRQMDVGVVDRPAFFRQELANIDTRSRLKGFTLNGKPVYETLDRKVHIVS
jgi:hypothetical protein